MASETPVLIGFFGESVPDGDQTAAEELSKFGGNPVWIDGKIPDGFPFNCSLCGVVLDFVCQVATPYGANKRCLYFFCCHAQATCGKRPEGWKVLRGVVEPSAPAQAEAEAYGAAHTSFKRENDDLAAADPSDWLQVAFGSRTAPNTCSEKGNGKPKARDTKVALPASKSAARLQQASEMMQAFFVEVENEPPDSSHLDATGLRARELQLEYEQSSGAVETEAYEESPDKVFLKLQKRLSRSPKQAIRYSFGGKPLFISPLSKRDAMPPPPCPHCSCVRVFEVQLVPAAAEEIQKRRHSADAAPVEWGVVVVFTCREDCVPSNAYAVEHVVVQEIL
ncbi:programmed cell death protein, putative [Eimeria tenella]|uniref:Programmed cell death protein, putative n=1 Tax=Eimeria tenella TaxID=5802 RepID=U6KR75_EIMTE|nr:programmed cell death protein, putative [Eimeria tenella]CDJ40451.1 programmed cell death protein, putative [Eimeria tenella]|eukprot:XP_013231201.1 programmed cell death protein, putative [Eimeria tenella]